MIGPFVTMALDVPRRMARSKILWALVVVVGILLVVGAAPLGFAHGDKGEIATLFGKEMNPAPDGMDAGAFRTEIATWYLRSLFVKTFCSWLGVFVGLLLLADAVPSAFAPGAAEVNLPKPVHRGSIVLARHLGAVLVATGLALFLVGGAVAIVYVRTGVLALSILAGVPIALLQFALLHALGTITGLTFQNAFLGALASILIWGAGWLTSVVGAFPLPGEPILSEATLEPGAGPDRGPQPTVPLHPEKPATIFEIAIQASRYTHRALPRANDLPDLAERTVLRASGLEPGVNQPAGKGVAYELELLVHSLVWTGFALGMSTLIVRRRDF